MSRRAMSVSSSGAIIRYYEGLATDDRGRYLSEIQAWPDENIEAVHDFIQWMFPLAERSGANPGAPVLDDDTIRQFWSRSELRDRLRASFLRMLRFYGLRQDPATSRVERAENFPERSKNWLSPWNHNHLRITRILKSLRVLGLERESTAFFECLAGIYAGQTAGLKAISDETFRYWRAAAPEEQGRRTTG